MTNIYIDKTTGLTWVMGPNKDTNYYEAKEFNGGHKKFRFPTCEEIKTLFRDNHKFNLYSSGYYFWTCEYPQEKQQCIYKFSILDKLFTWSGRESNIKHRILLCKYD